jgi:endonuclease-3
MPRETKSARSARAATLGHVLRATYPEAHCELNYGNPLELLIATILSAQSTDKQVNIVTKSLFEKYRDAKDYANAPVEVLENDLRTIGLFRSKAKNIKKCCQTLIDHYGGEVPRTMSDLTGLAGVGRKTANVVLGNAFQINEGVVVDTHVTRLANRLGLSSKNNPVEIEVDLQHLFPRQDWTILSHWLIWHGRRRCSARSPACMSCEVKALCPSASLFAPKEKK